jgi:hypothetical protein
MHRQYLGMKTIHLAEILASTDADSERFPVEATR